MTPTKAWLAYATCTRANPATYIYTCRAQRRAYYAAVHRATRTEHDNEFRDEFIEWLHLIV
jgi:hypothetical protein